MIHLNHVLVCTSVLFALSSHAQTEEMVPITAVDSTESDSASDEEIIYTVVQESPEFEGGTEALIRFLAENINYPALARDSNISGVVYMQLIILEDGNVDKDRIEVLRGVHPVLDSEAVRVARLMPAWKPGYQRGKPVKVYFNIPIRFSLR